MRQAMRRHALGARLAALIAACCFEATAQQQGQPPPSVPTLNVPVALENVKPNAAVDMGLIPLDTRRLSVLLITPGLIKINALGLSLPVRVRAYLSDMSVIDVTSPAAGTTYNVEDQTVASVSPDGDVTAVGEGVTALNAFNRGVKTRAFISVRNALTEQSLTVFGFALGFIGAQGQLQVFDNDSDGGQFDVTLSSTTYESDTPSVARVDANGLVTAAAAGTANITVSHLGWTASAPISVVISTSSALADLSAPPFPSVVRTSASLQMNVAGVEEDGSRVDLTSWRTGTTYETSAATVAVVTADGIVTPVGSGTAQITAANAGLSTSQDLHVNFSRLQSLIIIPSSGTIPVNPADPLSTQQLTVQGLYSDGTYADLTSSAAGTTYQTSNPLSANPGPSGLAAFTQAGQATITAVNGGVSASAQFTVTDFNPSFLGFYHQVGLTNVAVSSKTVYLTAGNGGLQIIDASNAAFLHMISSAPTFGAAVDVAVSAGRAFVAETSALAVFDVSNPAAPTRLRTIAGLSVQGVAVAGGLLYFVDAQTLKIYDATALTFVGQLASLPGVGQAVSVSAGLAFITAGAAGLYVVDVSTPAAPVFAANVPLAFPASSVAAQNRFAFVSGNAGHTAGQVSVVDATVATSPAVVGQTGPMAASGVAISGNLMLVAEQSYSQQIPLVDITTPQSPALVGFIPAPGKSLGQRVAVSGGVLYEVLAGGSGSQGLAAALFAPAQPPNSPMVSLTSPADGAAFLEGAYVPVAADAAAATAVSDVTFFLNGVPEIAVSSPPYNAALQIPPGTAGSLVVVSAQASDVSGYLSAVSSATVWPVLDPLTTVQGRLTDVSGNPIAKAPITVIDGLQTASAADGSFYLTHVPAGQGFISVSSTATVSGQTISADVQLPPVPGGVTDFGDVVLKRGGP